MTQPDFDTSSGELLGKEFGPYQLVRRLGAGGMAETFEAIRRGPGGFAHRVCLKLVLPFFREDEDFVALFHREAKLAAKLRHSNIVGIIDFGEVESTSYIALELVDGADLETLLNAQEGKRLSHELVALIGHDLAAALDHAHNPPRESGFDGSSVGPIIHRDISPSNVMVSRNGEILLTDFGVAKAVTGTSRKQSSVKGKIPYMSPEQLRDEPLDDRADLFSLGVVLFEALTGERPYQGTHDPATIMMILRGEHLALDGLAPTAPKGLCEIIERLIDPDADKRPRNAAALIELLDELVPSPRARRELGRKVAAIRPEESRTLDPAVDYAHAPTDPQTGPVRSDRASGSRSEPVEGGVRAEPRTRSRTKAWLIAAAVLLLSVAGAAGAWFATRDAPPAATTPPRATPLEWEAPQPREKTPTDEARPSKQTGASDDGSTRTARDRKPMSPARRNAPARLRARSSDRSTDR